jgi:hypothetical protein
LGTQPLEWRIEIKTAMGGLTMTDKRNSWLSKLSKWDDRAEKEWIQWIELVAGLSAMIVLTLSLLAVWDGKSP